MNAKVKSGSQMRGSGAVREPGETRVLPFRDRGNARLASLAAELRLRFAHCSPIHDPFLFLLSRRPVPRLALDRTASIAFLGERAEYRIEIEASADTRVTVETGDFNTIVDFVDQYLTARLAEPDVEGMP
jgi:hypothetical protein